MLTISDIATYAKEHRLLVLSLGIALFFVILFAVTRFTEEQPAATGPRYVPPRKEDRALGDPTRAKVILIVYTDLACPSCSSYHAMLSQLFTDTKGDVAIIYRHFPLSMTHPNADIAAAAASATETEEKYFAMVELLFGNQREWKDLEDPREHFARYAESLGIPRDRFFETLADELEDVRASRDAARDLHITTTPTFFLDGHYIATPPTPAELRTMIMAKLY